ncbi:MAG: DUF1343 domain-containing protein [Flavobacteriales bacterium]|nr:DUF1343 domain-containing protein [Flavobacteriales bacterium]
MACQNSVEQQQEHTGRGEETGVPQEKPGPDIRTAAEQTGRWLPLLQGKRVGVVANQTSMIGMTHLVDTMISLKINVVKVFAPEHGFRGDHGAGEKVKDGKDPVTGLTVTSLYGSHKKPTKEDLADVDVVVFDIQDVGARFYTYISTMTYVMEACAENKKPCIIFDRPNPNGFYVDGPVLQPELSSFIGLHPVPIVHGMTVGEYAGMVNGEGWLKDSIQCDITVIPCANWTHRMNYDLPVKPSPNLPNMESVYLYPSLCLFEGTVMSVGRGTDKPFQQFGHPDLKSGTTTFTPVSIPGVAADPKWEGKVCKGFDVSMFSDLFIKNAGQIYLFWLLESYKEVGGSDAFFRSSFDKLAGTTELRKQVMTNVTEEEIRKSWTPGITAFKKIRKKYLLYTDFEP